MFMSLSMAMTWSSTSTPFMMSWSTCDTCGRGREEGVVGVEWCLCVGVFKAGGSKRRSGRKDTKGRRKETYLRDEVHAPLTLLLLELQRDAAHRATRDALHQVRRETRDLVPQALRRDHRRDVDDLKGVGGRREGGGWCCGRALQEGVCCCGVYLLVRVEVHRQPGVVLLDNHARRLLHGLRANLTHFVVWLPLRRLQKVCACVEIWQTAVRQQRGGGGATVRVRAYVYR